MALSENKLPQNSQGISSFSPSKHGIPHVWNSPAGGNVFLSGPEEFCALNVWSTLSWWPWIFNLGAIGSAWRLAWALNIGINYIYIMYVYIYNIYIYIYIWAGTPTAPPQPDGSPPCSREGGFSQQPGRFSQQPAILYAKYIAQCKECASNVQGTAWAALVSIHRNHGVCSLYSAYSAYVSIIRMDILYVI